MEDQRAVVLKLVGNGGYCLKFVTLTFPEHVSKFMAGVITENVIESTDPGTPEFAEEMDRYGVVVVADINPRMN
jgi:hypothetical protein